VYNGVLGKELAVTKAVTSTRGIQPAAKIFLSMVSLLLTFITGNVYNVFGFSHVIITCSPPHVTISSAKICNKHTIKLIYLIILSNNVIQMLKIARYIYKLSMQQGVKNKGRPFSSPKKSQHQ
jgi:hypothetical protein